MAKRMSESARVVAYFQGADLGAAEAILGIAQEIMKRRRPGKASVDKSNGKETAKAMMKEKESGLREEAR